MPQFDQCSCKYLLHYMLRVVKSFCTTLRYETGFFLQNNECAHASILSNLVIACCLTISGYILLHVLFTLWALINRFKGRYNQMLSTNWLFNTVYCKFIGRRSENKDTQCRRRLGYVAGLSVSTVHQILKFQKLRGIWAFSEIKGHPSPLKKTGIF